MTDERYEPFPLTETQQAYLVGRTRLFELGGVSMHTYLEYDGELQADRFVEAWQAVVRRHDMLRAVVDAGSGTQRVLADPGPFPVEQLDVRDHPDGGEAALRAVRARLSHEVRPADRWPSSALVVSRRTDRAVRVHVGFDALTFDLASWGLLVRDLTLLYDDPGRALPPVPWTFRDHVVALATTPADQRERAERYWEARVADLPPAPDLPLVRDISTVGRPRFVAHDAVLTAPGWAAAKAWAARNKVTPSGLALGAFGEVLAAYGALRPFTVNVPQANRQPTHPEVGAVVGPFASFSLVALVDGDTVGDRIRAAQAQLWRDLPHVHVGGVHVLRRLMREHGDVGPALMPVVLTSTVSADAGDGQLLGDRLARTYEISQTPQVHLDVRLDERDGELHVRAHAVDDLYPPGVVDGLRDGLCTVLDGLADEQAWERDVSGLLPQGGGPARIPVHGPHPDRIPDRSATGHSAPAATAGSGGGPLRELVAGIWCDVLGAPAVHDDEGFFAVGGDVVAAAEVRRRLAAALLEDNLVMPSLFTGEPLGSVVAELRAREPVPGHYDEIARLHATLDDLSPEEIDRELARREP